MIYEVKKDNVIYKFDDTVLLSNQTEIFQKVFNENLNEDNISVFDNATLILTPYGRVLVNSIDENYGKI